MKIKILEIIGDATLAGGPRHLLSILESLNSEKFTSFLICPPGPLAGEVKSITPHVTLDIVPMHSRLDLAAIREIRANIKHIKPDIIHVHGTRAGVLGRLAAINLKIPVIYTEHLWTKQYRLQSRIAHFGQLVGLWFLDMFTDFNIAVSESVKDFMVTSQVSRASKIKVVYNGIKQNSQKNDIFNDDFITLGTVGTLNHQKGIQYLVGSMPKILKEFPETKLVIVGEGIFEKHLVTQIKRLKLGSHVKLKGFVKDVESELKFFDIYVQPSLSESFGLAIVQAMSFGIPIVATKAGGIPEVVSDTKSGLLVEPGSSGKLADAIIELMRDKELARKMGQNAREEVKVKFNLEDMIRKTEEIYEKVAQDRT